MRDDIRIKIRDVGEEKIIEEDLERQNEMLGHE